MNINKKNIFSFDSDNVGRIIKSVNKKAESAEKQMNAKMSKAVNMIYTIAHQKRPYITKEQAKAEGRRSLGRGRYALVSDPNADLGVPVAYINGGTLQISIQKNVSHEGTKTIGTVWTDNPYAIFLEMGTSKMQARPFMRPAYNLTIDAIKKMFATQSK